jgi:hypothetical protein
LLSNQSSRDIPTTEELSGFDFDGWLAELSGPVNRPCRRIMVDFVLQRRERSDHSHGPRQNVGELRTWIAMAGDVPVGIGQLAAAATGLSMNTLARPRNIGSRDGACAERHTVYWCRANGVGWIGTGNQYENKRMLSINIPMGYDEIPSEVEVMKEL